MNESHNKIKFKILVEVKRTRLVGNKVIATKGEQEYSRRCRADIVPSSFASVGLFIANASSVHSYIEKVLQ